VSVFTKHSLLCSEVYALSLTRIIQCFCLIEWTEDSRLGVSVIAGVAISVGCRWLQFDYCSQGRSRYGFELYSTLSSYCCRPANSWPFVSLRWRNCGWKCAVRCPGRFAGGGSVCLPSRWSRRLPILSCPWVGVSDHLPCYLLSILELLEKPQCVKDLLSWWTLYLLWAGAGWVGTARCAHEGERWPRPNDLHLLTCYDRASSL